MMNHGGVARSGGDKIHDLLPPMRSCLGKHADGGRRIDEALVSNNFEVGSNISRLELLS